MNNVESGQEPLHCDLMQVFCLEQEIENLEQNTITAKGRLEHLKNEIAQAEQSLREIEARLKDEQEMFQELHDQRGALTDQKASLEEQCEKLSEDINAISKTLQDKKDELDKVRDELADAEREKKLISKKRGLALKAALFLFIAVIICSWIYFNNEISSWESLYEDVKAEKEAAENLYEGVKAEKEETDGLYEDVKAKKEEAESLYEDIKAEKEKVERLYEDTKKQKEEALAKITRMEAYADPAMIQVNRVYNSGGEMKESDELKASEMRYLMFDFDIFFFDDDVKDAAVYLDIYYPDGSLNSSPNSPTGHTRLYDIDGTGNVDGGWGNSTTSIYPAGTYRVDFIYNDVIIHSQKVEIAE